MSDSALSDTVQTFKQAMRRLTSAISVVTTAENGERYGMVATAICSLGINPPSLMISVAKTASMHEPLSRSGRFGVNILAVDQAELVGPFSGKVKGAERFNHGSWSVTDQGVPMLIGAQASVACNVVESFEYAGHTVFIGAVQQTEIAEDICPLLYENGSLARSAAL